MIKEKDLDQHFLVEEKVLQKITNNANLIQSDIVLEIGPGKGILTNLLVKNAKVLAVELDKTLFFELKKKFKDCKNIKLFNSNILNLIGKLNFNKIASNIPYSISEPLLKKILIKQPELVILCMGEKFVKYLEDNLLFNKIYSLDVLETISPNSFDPAPKVKSVLVKMKLKDDKDSAFFKELILQHDKKLKNSLMCLFKEKLTKNQVRKFTETLVSENKTILNADKIDIEKISFFLEKEQLIQ